MNNEEYAIGLLDVDRFLSDRCIAVNDIFA